MMTEDEQLEKLMKPENLSSIGRVIDLIKKLDEMGFLDVISGVLSDEDTMKTIFGILTNDDILSLTTKSDSLLSMLKIISEGENIKALSHLLEIIGVIQNQGLLDPILGLLKDDKAMGAVMGLISNDFTMNLIMNNKLIMDSLGTLDLSVTPHYVNMIKAIESAIKTDTVTPVNGMMGTLHAMKNEDAQKGLGIVFSILRSLGRICASDFNCGAKK